MNKPLPVINVSGYCFCCEYPVKNSSMLCNGCALTWCTKCESCTKHCDTYQHDLVFRSIVELSNSEEGT